MNILCIMQTSQVEIPCTLSYYHVLQPYVLRIMILGRILYQRFEPEKKKFQQEPHQRIGFRDKALFNPTAHPFKTKQTPSPSKPKPRANTLKTKPFQTQTNHKPFQTQTKAKPNANLFATKPNTNLFATKPNINPLKTGYLYVTEEKKLLYRLQHRLNCNYRNVQPICTDSDDETVDIKKYISFLDEISRLIHQIHRMVHTLWVSVMVIINIIVILTWKVIRYAPRRFKLPFR